MKPEALIQVEHLNKFFGKLQVLKDISETIREGEIVSIIGPSGSGKSTFLRCLNCMEDPTGGQIIFNGVDIADPKVDINIHRRHMGMVFQEPMTALNPLLTIGHQLTESIILHRQVNKKEAYEIAVEYMKKVGMSNPEERMKQYPFQLSGGLRQRVGHPRRRRRAQRAPHLDAAGGRA